MCFTPAVSLGTAVIEFIIASFILVYYRRSVVTFFLSVFVYILGIYQFTEFMLCVSGASVLWGKIGFITYTFLPVVALHFVLRWTGKRFWYELLYIFPLIATMVAFFTEGFIILSQCNTYFVTVATAFHNTNKAFYLWSYAVYYFGFIFLSALFLGIDCFRRGIAGNLRKLRSKLNLVLIAAFVLSLGGAILLLFIFPSMNIKFPSVYCELAILFSVAALLAAHWDSRLSRK